MVVLCWWELLSGVDFPIVYVSEHLLALCHNDFEVKYVHLHNTPLLQPELILLFYKYKMGIQGMQAASALSYAFRALSD